MYIYLIRNICLIFSYTYIVFFNFKSINLKLFKGIFLKCPQIFECLSFHGDN